MSSRTKKFMYNSITTAIYQIVVMLVGLVTPKILLVYYGSDLNGLVSSINQFIMYFNLVEAGIAGAAVYALYKPLAEKNENEISSIAAAAKKYYYQSGEIFTALIIGMAVIYPLFIKVEELNPFLVGILVIVLGAKGFLEFFTLAKYRVILTADQKTYVVSIASIVYTILQMGIVVFLSVLKCNIVIVYAFSIVALFARSLILMIYVKKKYSYINYKAKPKLEALNKRWDALFQQILHTVQTGAPIVLVTIFTTLKDVSIYTIYNMVLNGINSILSIFVNGVSASFGDIIARKEEENLKKVYRDFEYMYYFIISIVYSVSFIMIMPFIKVYTQDITDANYVQPLLGFLFVLNGLLYNLKTPQGTLIISAGHYREVRERNLIQALIIVILGVILTPSLGMVGVLIASCISNLYRDIDLLMYVPKYITKTKIRDTIKDWCMILTILLITIVPINFISMNTTGLLEWALKAGCVTIIVITLSGIVAFVFNKKQFILIINRFKNMVVINK